MKKSFVLFLMGISCLFGQQPEVEKKPLAEKKKSPSAQVIDGPTAAKVNEVISSGRVAVIGESSSERLAPAALIAPGAPPILAFRYFDGQARHRFGELDLVMDDAGH